MPVSTSRMAQPAAISMAPRAIGLKYLRLCSLRMVQATLPPSGMAPSTRALYGSTNTASRSPVVVATSASALRVGVAGGVYLTSVPGCAPSAAAVSSVGARAGFAGWATDSSCWWKKPSISFLKTYRPPVMASQIRNGSTSSPA